MRVIMPEKYGFCRGVEMAVGKAEKAICDAREEGLPCFVYGDIVHSRAVMDDLRGRGIVSVSSASEVEAPAIVVIRAHGITDAERQVLEEKGVSIVDATCPVVLRSQSLLRSSSSPMAVIGVSGHSEVATLLGSASSAVLVECPDDLGKLEAGDWDAVVQTTFSEKMLAEIVAEAGTRGICLRVLNTICKASQERREALLATAAMVEAFVVAGDNASKNTVELWESAKRTGKPSFLVSSPDVIPHDILSFHCVGLTAGASCPNTLLMSIKRRLENA